jgi:hypothetical protein
MKYYIVVEKENYKPFTYEYDLESVKKIMPIKDYSVVIMFANNELLQLDRVCSICVK